MSAAVAVALHIFHVTRAFPAWQTGTLESECAERSLQSFSQSDTMRAVIRVTRTKNVSSTSKNTKLFHAIYQNGKRGTLLQQAPKKFKTLCTAGENVSSGRRKRQVKMTLIRVLVVLAVMALGSTTVLADGIPAPMCLPSANCVTN